MRDAIELVRGAVSTKELVPVLTHFAVHEGLLHGFNGRVHLCAPVPELKGLSFTVPAVPFLKAVDACGTEPKVEQLEGRVRVSSGRFKALLPTGAVEAFPFPEPPPKKLRTKVPAPLLPVLKALRPFIGEDALRPWSAAVRVDAGHAFATNNVTLAAARVHLALPAMTLPVFAVDELLRIGLEPTHLSLQEHAAVFHLPGNAWCRTALFVDPWPDVLGVLHAAHKGAKLTPVAAGLLEDVQRVRPFCPDAALPILRVSAAGVATQEGEMSAEIVAPHTADASGSYHAVPLELVLSAATHADWLRCPRVPWKAAERSSSVALEGVLMGVRT